MIVVTGFMCPILSRIGFGRLPGDIVFQCNGVRRESPAGVFHQMPTIGDLGGVRERVRGTVSAAAVTSDDGNFLMLLKPSRGGCRFAVGQQRHRRWRSRSPTIIP